MKTKKIKKETAAALGRTLPLDPKEHLEAFNQGKNWNAKAEECQDYRQEKKDTKSHWIKPLLVGIGAMTVLIGVGIPVLLHFMPTHYGAGGDLEPIPEGVYIRGYCHNMDPFVLPENATATFTTESKKGTGSIYYAKDLCTFSGTLSFTNCSFSEIDFSDAVKETNKSYCCTSFTYNGVQYLTKISYWSIDGDVELQVSNSLGFRGMVDFSK
jgi:hypothetical protein